jgi:DNA-nicking Smr family endonuclease
VKKKILSPKDKKDWFDFTKNVGNLKPKEIDETIESININQLRKLDLHGYTLVDANILVKKFIIEAFNNCVQKILIITGKGTRSKSYKNPYQSEKLSILRNSVPDFIKDDKDLNSRIIKIVEASIKDGGEGAFYVYLKNNKKFKE